MRKKDQELLLKVLCAMLPYGVKCRAFTFDFVTLLGIDNGKLHLDYPTYGEDTDYFDAEFVRPALRPMSSMTEEEREEFRKVGGVISYNPKYDTWAIAALTSEAYDWLNKHYFDYHGLISKGLALEAPEGMYEK